MTNRRLALLQAAVSLISLAAVVWWASRQDRPALPHSLEALATVGVAALLYALATLGRAERWFRILRRIGVRPLRRDAYALTTVGYMGNNVLPARSGDLMRAFLLVPVTRTGKRKLVGTVVAERVLDVGALALLFVAVTAAAVDGSGVPSPLLVAVAAGVTLAVALAALGIALRRRRLIRRAVDFARPLGTATRNLVSGHGAALLVLSAAVWATEALVYLAVARAVGIELEILGAVYIVAFTNLFAMVPAAPGYIGTFDAAVVFALTLVADAASSAIAYLLLLRFVLFVPITLVGLVVLLARYGGWSRYRSARLEAMGAS